MAAISSGKMDSHRRSRRHGRRAAARGRDGRRLVSCRRMPAVAHRDAAAYALSRPPGHDLDEALAIMAQASRDRSRSRSACSAMPPRFFPSWCGAACAPTSVTDQTSAHDPVNGYLPKGWTTAEWEARRETDPKSVATRRARLDGGTRPRHAGFSSHGHSGGRLRQQHPPDGA